MREKHQKKERLTTNEEAKPEKEKTLAKAFLSDASKGFENGDLIFIIQ